MKIPFAGVTLEKDRARQSPSDGPDGGERLWHSDLGYSPWFARSPSREVFSAAMYRWSQQVRLIHSADAVTAMIGEQVIVVMPVKD